MDKLTWKPGTLLSPVPVVIATCGDKELHNAITIAWTGTVNSEPPMTYISMMKKRYSHDIVAQKGEFCINLVSADILRAADYIGVKSGRDVDKFAATGLQPQYFEGFECPAIEQSPMSLMCSVTQVLELGSHDMFLAEIKAVFVDQTLVDGKGKLKIEGADLIAFAHGQYFKLGKRLGNLGWTVRKKTASRRRK